MNPLRCVAVCIAAAAVCHTSLAALILFEGFNQATLPAGWTVSNPAPLSIVSSSFSPTATPYEGTHFVKFDSFNFAAETRAILAAPVLSTLGKTNVIVRFAWHRDPGYPEAQDRVVLQWSLNSTNWTNAGTFQRYATTAGWTLQSSALPATATNRPALFIRFVFISAYGNNCYLDAVRIEGAYPGEPMPPTAFTAAVQSASQITLQWQTNAAGDAVMIVSNATPVFGVPTNGVAYAPGEALPGGGVVLFQGAATSLVLTGLQQATRYYFRAWSVSAATNYSSYVSADAVTDFILPINEGFNTSEVPVGWTISNTMNLTFETSGTEPVATPYEGSHFVQFDSYFAEAGTRALLTTPRFSTQGGLADLLVDFAWHQDPGYSDFNDSMTLEWSSNGTHWVAAQTFYRVAPQRGWTLRRVRMPAAALGHPRLQLRFNFLSAYGNNCYLDDVRISSATPGVYVHPLAQTGRGGPGVPVAYTLNVLNLTGVGQDVLLSYESAWPVTGPAATGVLPHNAATNLSVQVLIPADAIDSQSCTTLVSVVTADAQFTNTALLITTCRWVLQPICEWFEDGAGFWQNYFAGGVNNGWYWNSLFGAVAHDQELGGTNWFVSPPIDLNQPWASRVVLSFWFGTSRNLLYPQGVYLITGNPNPLLGSAKRLANIQYTATQWRYNEINLKTYITNVPVYLAFEYVSTNPWQLLTGICIDASKTGIDNAVLAGPAALPAMTSYDTAPAITGALYISGATGTSGPAALVTAQVGFGPQGLAPDGALWTWFPATYLGAGGEADLFVAAPQLTMAGALNYCYRFRRGAAPWVYADVDGSSNGVATNKLGVVTVAQLPPQGALLRHQTIGPNWDIAPNSFRDQTVSPERYWETADDLTLPYDAIITAVRMGGVYWEAGRQNLEQGFTLRIYANAVTNPGTLLYQQAVPGYACEQLLGDVNAGYKYHVTLTTPLLLPAGQTVWIALQHEVQSNTFWSLLGTPDAIRGNRACQTSLLTNWRALGTDLGMEVYGVVTNAGTINGTVLDAESMAPIVGAQVLITNAVYINAVQTDSNGFYTTLAPAGTYEMVVTKPNYLPATAHGVSVTVGATTTMDFLLEGSLLFVTPTNITRTMLLNQQTVNPLVLSNRGPLAVDVALELANAAFTAFTSGVMTTSALVPAKTCYGVNIFQTSGTVSQLWRFTTMTPQTPVVTPIAPGGTVYAGDFIGADFTNFYALTLANQLIRINVMNGAVTVVGPAVPAAGAQWSGMAAAVDGMVYASANSTTGPTLYRINPATGAATLIGAIAGATNIGALAISPAGVLYGVDLAADRLVSINKATGAATVIGSLRFNANYDSAMDFDDYNNILYLATCDAGTPNEDCVLVTLNPATGSTNRYIGLLGNGLTQLTALGIVATVPPKWVRIPTNALTIAAGQAHVLDVTFDSSVVSNFGEYTADVTLQGTFVNHVAPVPLRMSIPPSPVISAPSVLNFGEVVIGDATNLPLNIRNVGIGVLSGQITAVTAPFSVVGADSYAIPSSSSSTHTLSFAPGAEGVYSNLAVLTGGGGTTVTLIGTGVPEPCGVLILFLAAVARALKARPRMEAGLHS